MEVHVDEPRQRPASQSSGEIAERVGRRDGTQEHSRCGSNASRLGEGGPRLARSEVRRPRRPGRAVHVAERRARIRHLGIRVPAPAAEERRLEAERSQAGALLMHPLSGPAARRPGVVGRGPVRVVSERPSRGRLARPLEPQGLVLARAGIRRPDQRGDRESARPTTLERREPCPYFVVERSFHVTGDDRVPFAPHVRRLYRHAYLTLVLAASLPRLVALLAERDDILAAYTDKSDDFARTFLDSGTFGFIPGVPSAYTQPLYGFFLIPIYWVDRSWVTVGLAHILVAVATALLVFEIGRRVTSEPVALLGALLATLHPYLVWHDVHLNREILDQLLAAAVVLLTIVAAERERTLWWSAALGGALGLAILGNARLALLPLVVGIWLAVRRGAAGRGVLALLVICAATAVVLAPWVVRNKVSVGCFAITTDSRALWKANNLNTYDVLARGGWIDDVPPLPGSPPSPQDAGAIYQRTGRVVEVDECAQMRLYRDEVLEFWREHPDEKLRLAGQSARLLWQPNVLETEGRPGAGTWRDTARSTVEPAFMIALYAFAVVGLFIAAAQLRPARAAPARLPDAHRDALRRSDTLPRALGLPHRDPGRGRVRRGHRARSSNADR